MKLKLDDALENVSANEVITRKHIKINKGTKNSSDDKSKTVRRQPMNSSGG